MFIAGGEIFSITSSYEIAFAIAPKEQKTLCSGLNLSLTIGLAGFMCCGLNQIFQSWFPQEGTSPNSSKVEDYASSKMGLYFLVLLVLQIFGIIINLIPFVCNWVERLRKEASDADEADFSIVSSHYDDKDSVVTPATAVIATTMIQESSLFSDIESSISISSSSSLQSITV